MADIGRPTDYNIEIYGLYCPNTNELVYIGKAKDSYKRLKSHLRDSKNRNTNLYKWVRNGNVPTMKVLCVCMESEWEDVEKVLILTYKEYGINLLNMAIGGNQPLSNPKTNAINGKNTAVSIHSNAKSRRLWELKHALACNLRYFKRIGRLDVVDRINLKLAGVKI